MALFHSSRNDLLLQLPINSTDVCQMLVEIEQVLTAHNITNIYGLLQMQEATIDIRTWQFRQNKGMLMLGHT